MSRVTRREWYERVNATWGDHPMQMPLTPEEAVRAARKLYRFETGRSYLKPIRVGSGRIITGYASRGLVVNPNRRHATDAGWRDVVHCLSHAFCPRPHGGEHARCEIRFIKEVLKRGWLDGSLKDEPKPEKPPVDKRAVKYARTLTAIKRWETKAKRADTALKKLRRSLRAQERVMSSGDFIATMTVH